MRPWGRRRRSALAAEFEFEFGRSPSADGRLRTLPACIAEAWPEHTAGGQAGLAGVDARKHGRRARPVGGAATCDLSCDRAAPGRGTPPRALCRASTLSVTLSHLTVGTAHSPAVLPPPGAHRPTHVRLAR